MCFPIKLNCVRERFLSADEANLLLNKAKILKVNLPNSVYE